MSSLSIAMNDHIPIDVMAALSHQGDVPDVQSITNLSDGLNSAGGSNKSRSRLVGGEEREEYVELLKNVYHDHNAQNYAQKERIATKILKGEYNVSQKYEVVSKNEGYNPFKQESHATAVLRRHQVSNKMFELKSQPASFSNPDPEVKKSLAIERNKDLGQGERLFVSRGKHVPAVPLHVPVRQQKTKIILPPKKDILAHEIALDAAKIKHFRGNMPNYRADFTFHKKREIEIRKKMASFKEKLFNRLREKHDPQLTDIMRTLDDSVIYNFIESYKGCTMSVDAILMHIGANVSPSTSATRTESLEAAASATSPKKISNVNGFQLKPRGVKSKGAGFRVSQRNKHTWEEGQNSFIEEGRPQSPSIISMQAMHQHMSAENLLPSMQPDKAITDDDLEKLGRHATSCDQLRFSNQPLGKVEVATRRPPRALKTKKCSAGQDAVFSKNKSPLPTLSSTNYGGMYVISSFRDSLD